LKLYLYNDNGKSAILGPFTGIKIEYCQHIITKTDKWSHTPLAIYDEAYGWTIQKGILKDNSYSNIEIME
jgi:hypothetical protein